MNVNLAPFTQGVSSLTTTLRETAKTCETVTKEISNECVKKAAKVTITVGPKLAQLTTPLAAALASWASVCILDNYLVVRAVDWNDWERCIRGWPNEQGIHNDYYANSWYPGFQKEIIRVKKQAIDNYHKQSCDNDLTQCQTCSRPDFISGRPWPPSDQFSQASFGINKLLPAALAVYLSGKTLNRLVGVARQYLYNCNDLNKLGESMDCLSVNNLEKNYQNILNLSNESKVSSVVTDVVLDKLSMMKDILPKRIPAPFIESENERIKIAASLALSCLSAVYTSNFLENHVIYSIDYGPRIGLAAVAGTIAAGSLYYGVTTLSRNMHSQQLANQMVPIINELGKHISAKTAEAIKNGNTHEIDTLRGELKTILHLKLSRMKDIYYHAGFHKRSILTMVRPLEVSLNENLQRLELRPIPNSR